MATASGNTEKLSERVITNNKILTLKEDQSQEVDEEGRMESSRICAEDTTSRDTRCLVVLEGFNGKQGKQYFWERQRAKEKIKNNKVIEESTLEKENEECDYKIGCHAETYILARLDLYLEEKRSTGAESLTSSFGKMYMSNDQRQNADVQQEDDVQEKIVTIYTNYSPCEKTTNKNFPSCMKRIIEFLTAHDDITMNINYAKKYKSGKSDDKSDITPLKDQLDQLTRTNRLNIRSPLELMIDNMERIIRER